MKQENPRGKQRLLAMGQCDIPQIQQQPICYLDPYRSNVAVFGEPMSGKTVFIKNLLVRLHEDRGAAPSEDIYIIDFGGNIGAYGKLGRVCACFDQSNEENIKRVFRTIEKRLTENARQLDSRSYYSVVSREPEDAPTHIFLIVENINAFLADERYTTYQDKLLQLCRDGLSKGLTVVITGNDTGGLHRFLSNFGQKFAFGMSNESYYDIFNTKVSKPMRIPGRGVMNLDAMVLGGQASQPLPGLNGVVEFQGFLPFPSVRDETYIQDLVAQTKDPSNPNLLEAFSGDLTRENYPDYCAEEHKGPYGTDQIAVGLDYYEHKPVLVNLQKHRSVAIYGKREFGKSNLLALLLQGIRQERPDARFVYFDDGREELNRFYKPGEHFISENAVYYSDIGLLRDYLADNGYISTRREGSPQASDLKETPFTVFVMQSRMLYRIPSGVNALIKNFFPLMIANAETRGYLFIFSDVPQISDVDVRRALNDNISAAFLLDNIGEFMTNQGDKTAFGVMDVRALKAEYAQCTVGDGYFYDVMADRLKKLKFIKVM